MSPKTTAVKIKSKNEIRIASIFRNAPDAFVENAGGARTGAHQRERPHSFYQLCCHMEPEYHQLELDARLFMIYLDLKK